MLLVLENGYRETQISALTGSTATVLDEDLRPGAISACFGYAGRSVL